MISRLKRFGNLICKRDANINSFLHKKNTFGVFFTKALEKSTQL